jgi:isopentenyldiphosphate isomerase/intracellular septation protein A
MLDRKTLLKNFTIGFLPLLVFIVADELFGLTIGLVVAILFGLAETILTYLKEKRIDRFILFDTSLILVLGLISLILQNDIFFKLKPGLIELILVILLGLTAFSSNPILIKMSGRYMKGIEFSAEQMEQMKSMMRRMFFIFTVHTALIFYSVFYMSKEAWAFISGGLFYILMAGMIAIEFVRSRFQNFKIRKKFEGEEWFDIVQPDGRIVGKAPRSVVHGNPDLMHAVVHVHIINSKGEIFLQKRNEDKDIQPGKWDTAIGGHVHSGESIEHALNREAEEELGISMVEFQPLFRYPRKSSVESELIHGFLLLSEGPFYPDPGEISDARFWNIEEIEENLGQNLFTPNFEEEFQLLLKIVFRRETDR